MTGFPWAGVTIQPVDVTGFFEPTPPPVPDKEPPCLCPSPSLHEPTCEWMAWRKKQREVSGG